MTPEEICDHGSQKRKCPHCEYIDLEAQCLALRAENLVLRSALMAIKNSPSKGQMRRIAIQALAHAL